MEFPLKQNLERLQGLKILFPLPSAMHILQTQHKLPDLYVKQDAMLLRSPSEQVTGHTNFMAHHDLILYASKKFVELCMFHLYFTVHLVSQALSKNSVLLLDAKLRKQKAYLTHPFAKQYRLEFVK